jgi:hypothetical protein
MSIRIGEFYFAAPDWFWALLVVYGLFWLAGEMRPASKGEGA